MNAIDVDAFELDVAQTLDEIARARRRERKRAPYRTGPVLDVNSRAPRTPGERDTLTESIAMSGDGERVFAIVWQERHRSFFAERAAYEISQARRHDSTYRWLRMRGVPPKEARMRVHMMRRKLPASDNHERK